MSPSESASLMATAPGRASTGVTLPRGRGAITRRVLDVSKLLRQERVTLSALFERLGSDGLGLVLLLLTLPVFIPVPGPNGMIFGALIAVVALQLMAGADALRLPSVLGRRSLSSRPLRVAITMAWPWFVRSEPLLREDRLPYLVGRGARVALAFPLLLLGVAIMLPIPFGNIAPALALTAFSLGFVARDGAAVLVALVLSLAALSWTGFLFVAGAEVLERASALTGW